MTARRKKNATPNATRPGIVAANHADKRIAPDATLVNESESPLAWLARRKLIEPAQFAAGERLRGDFTLAGLTPRIGANWSAPVASARRGAGDAGNFSDMVLAAKTRLRRAVEAAGPEFSGLLLDVCCFLKGLETVERERGWPRRTSKIVLALGLDRLARHYGICTEIRGRERAPIRAWQAEDARPEMGMEQD